MTSTDRNAADDSILSRLGEVIDLSAGFGVMVLPYTLIAVPGLVLFVVLPLAAVAALAAIPVMLAAPPYLLVRRLRRRARS
jgi:hypothetical protein